MEDIVSLSFNHVILLMEKLVQFLYRKQKTIRNLHLHVEKECEKKKIVDF